MNYILNKIGKPAIIIPFVIFILAKLFAYFIAIQGNCWDGFGPECWVRWDSALYMEVAEKGHTLFPCGTEQGYPPNSGAWCGNAGWAPLYPLLMLLVSKVFGLTLSWAGIVLSTTFFLGYLCVVAKLIEVENFGIRNWLLMGIFAFCPGNIYFHAVFPLSQVAFLLSLFFLFLQKEKFLVAGVLGFLAVISYSIGFFLIGALGLYGAYLFFTERQKFLPFAFKTGAFTLAGLIGLFVYDQWSTEHWNALFLIQRKYGHGLNAPWKIMGVRWQLLLDHKDSLNIWVEIQNFIMIGYVLLCTWYLIKSKELGVFRIFHALYMFVFWFLPYSASSDVALYRNAAVLGPGHSLHKRGPLWLIALILAIFIGLSYPLGILFIQSRII